MNLDRLRETDDRYWRGIPTRFACLPDRQLGLLRRGPPTPWALRVILKYGAHRAYRSAGAGP
jgi:hypothetical protein